MVGSRVLDADARLDADDRLDAGGTADATGRLEGLPRRRHARPTLRLLAIGVAIALVGSVSDAVVAGPASRLASTAGLGGHAVTGTASTSRVAAPPPGAARRFGPPIPNAASATVAVSGAPSGPSSGMRLPVPTSEGSDAWPAPDDIALAAASVNLVYHVKTNQKVIALTFDDGWSPARGQQILDILEQEHVAATFFVNSVYVRWAPGLWREIAAAGFPIGNHTYLHRDVTKLTTDQIVAELDKNGRVFEELTGYTLAPLFRPPFGARNRATDVASALAGYPNVILWDTSAGDATTRPSISREIHNATRGGPGSIVLMHVGPVTTPKILTRVIESYRARGFTFVTIPQLLALQG